MFIPESSKYWTVIRDPQWSTKTCIEVKPENMMTINEQLQILGKGKWKEDLDDVKSFLISSLLIGDDELSWEYQS